MNISYVKFEDKEKNKVEFDFCDFPYIDGNDLLIKYLQSFTEAEVTNRIDGIHYIITYVKCRGVTYEFVWHEDVGNYVYCEPQTEENIAQLEKDVAQMLEILKSKIKVVHENEN